MVHLPPEMYASDTHYVNEAHHLEIEEIGSSKKSQGMDATRANEIRRMAQSMAAERLAATQAASTGQPVAQTSELQEDAVKLSDKAVSQVGESSPGMMNRRTQLRDSVLDKLNNEILDPNSDFNRKKGKKAQQSGDGQKKKKVEQKREWEPTAKPGQIHEGREVIGKIRVTEEVKEEGGNQGAVGAAGQSGASKANTQAASPSADGKGGTVQPAASSQPSKQASDSQPGVKESKEASAAQSMEKQGLKVEGAQPTGQTKSKQEEQSVEGAGGAGKTKEFDVRGRAFGTTQTQTIKPAKTLQPEDKSLGTFRRLDDKPMLKYVTLHSKNGQDAEQELIKNAKKAGESPEAIQQAVERLRDRSQTDA